MASISEEIFSEFFKRLEREENFPSSIVEELKRLFISEEWVSQEKVFEALRMVCKDVSKN